jgi:ribose transport system permease protein
MAPETIQRTEVTQRSSPLQAAFARASGRRLPLARMLRDGGVLVVLVLLFVVLSATTDTFLTSTNLLNVLDSATPLGIIAVAGTLVIISGGFDLSAGAVYTVAAIVATLASNATSVPLGLAAGLAAGLALGCWNGAICTVGRVNHFVGTLGTSIAFGGLATVISNAQLLELHDQRLGDLYGTQILGVNVVVYIFVIFAVACAVLLNKTVLGRHMIITLRVRRCVGGSGDLGPVAIGQRPDGWQQHHLRGVGRHPHRWRWRLRRPGRSLATGGRRVAAEPDLQRD